MVPKGAPEPTPTPPEPGASPYSGEVAACPPRLKLRGTTGKYLLKKALEPFLPRGVLYRRKMGFGMPVAEWFRGELGEMAGDLLLSARALQRGYFRRDAVDRLIAEHRSCRSEHGAKLWVLLFLELWFREFVDTFV